MGSGRDCGSTGHLRRSGALSRPPSPVQPRGGRHGGVLYYYRLLDYIVQSRPIIGLLYIYIVRFLPVIASSSSLELSIPNTDTNYSSC